MNSKFLLFALFFVSVSISYGKSVQTIKINSQNLSNDVKGVYSNIQAFFNSMFNNAVNLEIVDNGKKTVRGGITFNGGAQKIEPGHIVFVTIEDVSIMDTASVKLAQSVYLNPTSFPIDFSIDIDSKLIKQGRSYSLAVRIEKNGVLRYISDTNTEITDQSNSIIEYPILINVVKTGNLLPLPPQSGRLRTIRGELFSSDSDCSSGRDQTIKITISDVSLMDAPSVELTSKEYKIGRICRLPFTYEFMFDASDVESDPWKTFSVSARIIDVGSNKLKFVSDFNNPLVDGKTGKLNEVINIHLVKIRS